MCLSPYKVYSSQNFTMDDENLNPSVLFYGDGKGALWFVLKNRYYLSVGFLLLLAVILWRFYQYVRQQKSLK